jgi:hypothetical protein
MKDAAEERFRPNERRENPPKPRMVLEFFILKEVESHDVVHDPPGNISEAVR